MKDQRLIDANKLKITNTYALVNNKTNQNGISFAPMCCVLKTDIDSAPVIEIPERHKGEWVRVIKGYMWHYECNNCHEKPLRAGEYECLSDFCPNCGADMRGDDNEQ